MNPDGVSKFNQARIEWAIRLRYSPMPELDMQWLASQLNAFRIGELRVVGKTWEIMMERDGELAVNSDKRKSDAAGLEWQIVSDGSPDGDRHAQSLQYFYDNLKATKALDQDSTGGVDELIYQALSSLDYYYSAHEILLRVDNPAAKEVTAEFRHTPLWFLESRRGYLGYLQHIFDMYGQPCIQGEWLTAVNLGWMRPLTMAYAAKWFAFTDWMIFCRRYGSGFLEGITDAQKDSQEWTDAEAALTALANDGVVLHNGKGTGGGAGVEFKFLEQQAKNQLPFQPITETIDRLYAKCYRGVDLATGSRSGHRSGGGGEGGSSKSPVGASVQKEESGIFLMRDAKWTTGTFNERIDRPIIRYLFNQEPRAWFVLVPPLDDTTDADLNAVKTLVPMGMRVMLKEAYKRFRFSPPEPGEPCLEAPLQPAGDLTGGNGDNRDGKSKPQDSSSRETPNPKLPKPESNGAGTHTPAVEDRPTSAARESLDDPIGAGARPAAFQSADRGMPDTQVDGSAMFSRVGLNHRGTEARSKTLPGPALGYSLPNAELGRLTSLGLGNSRAAQGLRRSNRQSSIAKELALANTIEASGKRLILEAIVAEFESLNQRLAAIAEITDAGTQRDKLAALLADLDQFETNLHKDPAIAQAIYKILAAGVGNGIEMAAASRPRMMTRKELLTHQS